MVVRAPTFTGGFGPRRPTLDADLVVPDERAEEGRQAAASQVTYSSDSVHPPVVAEAARRGAP
jgi:hypothetical protein